MLLAIGAVGIVLTSMLFRWEGTDPIPRRSLAIIAIAFVAHARRVGAARRRRSRWATCPARAAIEPGAAAGQVLVLRGATVLDGLGGRIVNARVVIRDHRDRRSVARRRSRAAARRRDGRGPARPLPDSRLVRLARALGRIGRHRRGADRADRRSPGARPDRDAGRRRDVGGVAHRQPQGDARAVERRGGRASCVRRARSIRVRRSPRRAGIPSEMFSFLPGLAELLTRQVETPEAARAAIAELDRERVDIVKLVLEPGFEARPLPRLRDDVFRAAMAEAKIAPHADDRSRRHRRGRAAGDRGRRQRHRAHRARPERRDDRADGGEEDHLHADARRARLGLEARRVAAAAMPTFAASRCRRSCSRCSIRNRRSRRCSAKARWRRMMAGAFAGSLQQTAKAIRAGVPVLAGSDAGNPVTFHGISLIRELELLAQAGMPLTDVLEVGDVARGRSTSASRRSAALPPARSPISSCSMRDPTEQVGAYRKVVDGCISAADVDQRCHGANAPDPRPETVSRSRLGDLRVADLLAAVSLHRDRRALLAVPEGRDAAVVTWCSCRCISAATSCATPRILWIVAALDAIAIVNSQWNPSAASFFIYGVGVHRQRLLDPHRRRWSSSCRC